MSIDNANKKDLIPIKEALSIEFLKDYPDIIHWFEKSSNEFLTEKRPIFTVKLDDEMIGFIILNGKNSYLKGNVMYICLGFRRKGYGRKLLEYVENFAIKNNYTSFRFCIKKSRDEAVKFFMDNGYKIFKELKDNSEVVYELFKEFPSEKD